MIFTRTTAVFLVAVLFATAAFGQSKGGDNPIQGVWKMTEYTTPGMHVQNAQPGFYIFTGKYYSFMAVIGDKERPDVPMPATSATADQLRASWGLFQAQSGTYEIKGDEVTVHALVAQNPDVMRGGFVTYTLKVEGNTLTLVSKRNQNGPSTNPITWKLTRVE